MEDKEMQTSTMQDETVETTNEENVVEETTGTCEGEVVEETEEKPKADENLERLQRLMAEFDNYRKRTEKEKQNIYDLAVSSTLTELLGTVDNLERALKQESEDKSFYEGVSMIYKQLISSLEKLHVTPIEAAGETFNPDYHNAVLHIEDDSLGENIVAEELQKGYLYKEKVIRYSMVKVAN
ncbi:nucleotide exchange factor GrpE [Niameybacter massiliensis]|uniref:Protein GrpE n=1 Tax=Holtiella tumoricola TaxID=3018743 RepID=A0AA42J2D8_9FIRM|nr:MULTISPECIES: nucleotide exchange factor GrpE [Lachnospirales]MDA3733624.1 nucleotide exchange factor GrpE [Holtiella tumoricola]